MLELPLTSIPGQKGQLENNCRASSTVRYDELLQVVASASSTNLYWSSDRILRLCAGQTQLSQGLLSLLIRLLHACSGSSSMPRNNTVLGRATECDSVSVWSCDSDKVSLGHCTMRRLSTHVLIMVHGRLPCSNAGEMRVPIASVLLVLTCLSHFDRQTLENSGALLQAGISVRTHAKGRFFCNLCSKTPLSVHDIVLRVFRVQMLL